MSAGPVSVPLVFHPWRRLRSMTAVDVQWHRTPGVLGATDGATVIVLHPDQSQAQRRCTLAHELAHIELGHVHGASASEESAARLLAARRLIEMPALLDALSWAEDLREVADELWVDEDTLMARLDGLTCNERYQVTALYDEVERGC